MKNNRLAILLAMAAAQVPLAPKVKAAESVSKHDPARLAAAITKRERKNAKRLADQRARLDAMEYRRALLDAMEDHHARIATTTNH